MAFQRLSDEEFVERIRRSYHRRRVLGLFTFVGSLAGAAFAGGALVWMAYRIDSAMRAQISDFGYVIEKGMPPRSFFSETVTQAFEVHMLLSGYLGFFCGLIIAAFLFISFFGLLQLLGTRSRSTELLLRYFDATREYAEGVKRQSPGSRTK